MNKQVIFVDDSGTISAGIYCEEDNKIICGCCGHSIKADQTIILHTYKDWLDISSEIGSDGLLENYKRYFDNLPPEKILSILSKAHQETYGKKTL